MRARSVEHVGKRSGQRTDASKLRRARKVPHLSDAGRSRQSALVLVATINGPLEGSGSACRVGGLRMGEDLGMARWCDERGATAQFSEHLRRPRFVGTSIRLLVLLFTGAEQLPNGLGSG
jgi:hypothetical protein